MNIIEIIHLLIFFYLSIGGYVISEKYIPVYLLTIPYIIIDWNDKDGLCWITKLNNMIKYKTFNPIVQEENENHFIKTHNMPKDIEPARFYRPGTLGFEVHIAKRLNELWDNLYTK